MDKIKFKKGILDSKETMRKYTHFHAKFFFLLKELHMYRKGKLFKQKFFVYRVLRNVKQDMYIHKCKSDNSAEKLILKKKPNIVHWISKKQN